MKEFYCETENQEHQNVIIEKRNDDVYIINYKSTKTAEKVIKKISNYFNEPPFYLKETIDTILNKDGEWRFEGTFSLKLLKDNQLMLDNRNGKGVKDNQNRLVEIIKLLNDSQG